MSGPVNQPKHFLGTSPPVTRLRVRVQHFSASGKLNQIGQIEFSKPIDPLSPVNANLMFVPWVPPYFIPTPLCHGFYEKEFFGSLRNFTDCCRHHIVYLRILGTRSEELSNAQVAVI